MPLIPTVLEADGRAERAFDLYSRLLRDRIVFLGRPVDELERLVLRWDDEGTVELELVEHPAGTLVHVRETAPEWGIALDLHASAAWATA